MVTTETETRTVSKQAVCVLLECFLVFSASWKITMCFFTRLGIPPGEKRDQGLLCMQSYHNVAMSQSSSNTIRKTRNRCRVGLVILIANSIIEASM